MARAPKLKTTDPVHIFHVTLKDGRTVQFFANVDTNLLVIDVVDADERGGVEILRRMA